MVRGFRQLEYGEEQERSDNIPLIYVSSRMADQILKRVGEKKGHKGLEKKIQKKGQPISKEINLPVKLQVKKHKENLTSENVLGYLEGTEIKDELVVIKSNGLEHLERLIHGQDSELLCWKCPCSKLCDCRNCDQSGLT